MKQTVEEVAYDYATNKTKFRKDVLKEVDADTYVSRHADSMEDFQCGAEWQSKQSPWINVKERLPEEEQKIFVLTMGYGVPYIQKETFRRSNNLDIKGIWTHGNSIVLAWLPIPSFDDILKNRIRKDFSFCTGSIIGSVEIIDCVQNHPSIWAEKGVYNWVLANPILYENPIKDVKGKLSFWDYPGIKEVKIECPECGSIEIAVEDYTTAPFPTYLHRCNKCEHVIIESEWKEVKL